MIDKFKFPRLLLVLLTGVVLAFTMAACGDDDDDDEGGSAGTATAPAETTPAETPPAETAATTPTGQGEKITEIPGADKVSITVGSKNFPEQFVLGNIYAEALDEAGYNVKKDLDIGSEVVAYKALKQGEIDAYPEYTGTALTSFFKVKTADVPRDAAKAYEDAKAGYAKNKITAYAPTPFENTYRLGITKATAKKLGNPTKISDLADKASTLSITGYPECRQRTDCLIGLQDTYGMKFKKFVSSNSTYQVLNSGDADVAFIFTTDGDLKSGKYVVLDDDKKFFPPYNITFGVRDSVAKKLGPEGQALIENIQKNMTNEVLQELNARVVIDKEKPEDVAELYLDKFGYTD